MTKFICLLSCLVGAGLSGFVRVQPANLQTMDYSGKRTEYKDQEIPVKMTVKSSKGSKKAFSYALHFIPKPGFFFQPQSDSGSMNASNASKCIFISNNGYFLGSTPPIQTDEPFKTPVELLEYLKLHPEIEHSIKTSLPLTNYTHLGTYPILVNNMVFSHAEVLEVYLKQNQLVTQKYLLNMRAIDAVYNAQTGAKTNAMYLDNLVHNHFIIEYAQEYPEVLNNPKAEGIITRLKTQLAQIQLRGYNVPASQFTSFFDNTVRNEMQMNLYISTMMDAIYRGEEDYQLLLPKRVMSRQEIAKDDQRMERTYLRLYTGLYEELYRTWKVSKPEKPLDSASIDKVVAALRWANNSLKALPEVTFEDAPSFNNRMTRNIVKEMVGSKTEFFYWYLTYQEPIVHFIMDYTSIVQSRLSHFTSLFVDLYIDSYTITQQKVLEVLKYYDPKLVPDQMSYLELFEDSNRLLI